MNTFPFSQRVQHVPSSGIGFMMKYASQYEDVISLGQGTPLFPTPSFIYDAVYEQAKHDPEVGMYSSPKLEKPLLTLIQQHIQKHQGFTPDLDQLYLTIGGVGGLFSAMMAFLEKGDEIIYFDPSYPIHLSEIYLTQATPVFVPYNEEKAWKIDLDLLKKRITSKTKAILLTNPNNPTGTVLSENEVRELSKIILEHNLMLILDEAYDFLTYETPLFSPLQIEELRPHIIACKSFSKEFAMTGWRIGYVYADPQIIRKIMDVHVYFSISPSTPSIIAATAALSDPRGEQAKALFIEDFKKSRTAICERLDNLPNLFSYHKPQGAYYAFPKIDGSDIGALEFAKQLVDEAKVITIPGDSMGPSGKDHLRMSFAAKPEVIHKAFDRIDTYAKKLGLLMK